MPHFVLDLDSTSRARVRHWLALHHSKATLSWLAPLLSRACEIQQFRLYCLQDRVTHIRAGLQDL